MKDDDLRVAWELRKRLTGLVEILDFKVFGSRARGDADEYADLDVFCKVEAIDGELKDRIFDIVWDIGFRNGIVISTLIFTREELENSPLRVSPIVEVIAEEGVSI